MGAQQHDPQSGQYGVWNEVPDAELAYATDAQAVAQQIGADLLTLTDQGNPALQIRYDAGENRRSWWARLNGQLVSISDIVNRKKALEAHRYQNTKPGFSAVVVWNPSKLDYEYSWVPVPPEVIQKSGGQMVAKPLTFRFATLTPDPVVAALAERMLGDQDFDAIQAQINKTKGK